EASAGYGSSFGHYVLGQMARAQFPGRDGDVVFSIATGLSEVFVDEAVLRDDLSYVWSVPGASHPAVAWFWQTELALESRGADAFIRGALGAMFLLNGSSFTVDCDRSSSSGTECLEESHMWDGLAVT